MMQKNDPTNSKADRANRPMSPQKVRNVALNMSSTLNKNAFDKTASQVTDNAIKNAVAAGASTKKVATNFYSVSSNEGASAPDGDPKVILESVEQIKDAYEINGE